MRRAAGSDTYWGGPGFTRRARSASHTATRAASTRYITTAAASGIVPLPAHTAGAATTKTPSSTQTQPPQPEVHRTSVLLTTLPSPSRVTHICRRIGQHGDPTRRQLSVAGPDQMMTGIDEPGSATRPSSRPRPTDCRRRSANFHPAGDDPTRSHETRGLWASRPARWRCNATRSSAARGHRSPPPWRP